MKLFDFRNGNWGLKLLALVLAILIYFTIKNDPASGGRHHDRITLKHRHR